MADPVSNERRRLSLGSTRQRWILLAALAPPTAWAISVWHYAVNAPFQDDWSVTPVVSAAMQGRLSISALWRQHAEARLPIPYLFFAASGFVNHLNLRSIVILNSMLFVATFLLMLLMFRTYAKRPLTAWGVLSLGVMWFSFVDLEAPLWAFLLTWYLALLFMFIVIYLLLVRPHNRVLAIALAVPIAICASLSWVHGFLVWPVGLVCLLWIWTKDRRNYGEVGIWLATGLLTTLLYVHGYKEGVGCAPAGTDCSIRSNLSQPILFVKFFLALVANAVPVRVQRERFTFIQLDAGFMQLLGAILCLASLYVIVRSIRERRTTKLPLPLLLIVLALLFDVAIALGRANEGVPAALQSRFMIPNLLLLVGILAYALEHLPTPRAATHQGHPKKLVALLVILALGAMISFQATVGTNYGIRVARFHRSGQLKHALTAANFDRIPFFQRGCYASVYMWNQVWTPQVALVKTRAVLALARRDHLIVFAPATYRRYRAEGPPKPPIKCLARHGVPIP